MGVYSRFKSDPDGFRKLVELLETTPIARRQKMIDVGRLEDVAYTELALKYVMTFEDVISLPDLELAEVIAAAPPRIMGLAVSQSDESVRSCILRNTLPALAAQIRDFMGVKSGLREVGGAQLKLVEVARSLERKGLVKAKRIPDGVGRG